MPLSACGDKLTPIGSLVLETDILIYVCTCPSPDRRTAKFLAALTYIFSLSSGCIITSLSGESVVETATNILEPGAIAKDIPSAKVQLSGMLIEKFPSAEVITLVCLNSSLLTTQGWRWYINARINIERKTKTMGPIFS